MKRPAIASADGRPRVHIRETRDGATVQYGATGTPIHARDPVEAFRLAFETMQGRDFVTFMEGAQHG